VNFFERGDLLT